MLLRCLLVGEVQEEDAGEGADQEDDVEPTMVKVELQLPQDVRHDGAILQRHAHPHQQHARHKVHPLRERGPCFIRSLELELRETDGKAARLPLSGPGRAQ